MRPAPALPAGLVFESVPAPAPWSAFRVGFGAYPLPEAPRASLSQLVERLADALRASLRVEPTLWLDTQELHRDNGSRIFSRNASAWSPTMGFAFDPTGPAPRTLELADLMDADFGTPPTIYSRSAIFVRNLENTASAYTSLAGRGLATFLFFPADSSAAVAAAAASFMANSRSVLQPMMQSGAFANYTFYLPLLSSRSVAAASAPALESWLGDTEIYLREAFEANELFLLARGDLHPAFHALSMQKLSAADGPSSWLLPDPAAPGSKPSIGPKR